MLRWAIRAVAANSYRKKAISESSRASSKANDAKRKFSYAKREKDTNKKLDYKALDISNGSMAMSAYKELRNSSKNIDIETTRKNLFKYCRLDTYAMYAIYKKILQI